MDRRPCRAQHKQTRSVFRKSGSEVKQAVAGCWPSLLQICQMETQRREQGWEEHAARKHHSLLEEDTVSIQWSTCCQSGWVMEGSASVSNASNTLHSDMLTWTQHGAELQLIYHNPYFYINNGSHDYFISRSDEPIENDHLMLYFLSALWSISASFSS